MNVKHTLSEDLMMGYAAGNLPEAFDLVIASHLSMSDESRAGVEAYEAVGGALLEDQIPLELSAGALEACMCRIDTGTPIQAKRETEDFVFPKPLRDVVGGDLDAVKWRSIGNGVKQSIIETSGSASVRLLSIPGGIQMPEHGHNGIELTLVLKGAFNDDGDRFGRGDIEIATEDLDHQPVAELGETCICLAASEGALRFNGLLPRMLQPLFRI